VDKRENYIKRCVGTPGDWLELKESILYVNDKRAYIAPQQNLLYEIQDFKALTDPEMMAKYTVDANTQYDQARDQYGQRVGPIQGVHVNRKAIKRLKKDFTNQKFNLRQRVQYSDNPSLIPTPYEYMNNIKFFPNDPFINNTVTDFHKFQIPKKGQQIKINPKNIAYYRRIISAYEGHNLVEKEDGTILIDGKKATNYTFAMNYYWMMGDNRFNSADSRMWGFVPEDHIVGKASMVWLSNDPYGGFRWDRMFTAIK
jgi:signal peptidase I